LAALVGEVHGWNRPRSSSVEDKPRHALRIGEARVLLDAIPHSTYSEIDVGHLVVFERLGELVSINAVVA
jgi:hypothetical protein